MPSDHGGITCGRRTTCRVVITPGHLQPADRMATPAFLQNDRCRIQTGVRIKCRPCGRETMSIPAQIDLCYPDINTFCRIMFQEHLQCLPGLQTCGITVPFSCHIYCPGPGSGHVRLTKITTPLFQYSGHRFRRHGRFRQGNGIQKLCGNTMGTGHPHIPVRYVLNGSTTDTTAGHHQQNRQNAATRHPSAPCCSTTGIFPSPKRSQRPAS